MRKFPLYIKLCWLFFIALFVPTATLTPKIDALLAELKGEALPP
jgi:hypothetical protein